MITRHYFYDVKVYHGDGTLGYGCIEGIFTIKSLFPRNPATILSDIRDEADTRFRSMYPNGSIEATAFNRI